MSKNKNAGNALIKEDLNSKPALWEKPKDVNFDQDQLYTQSNFDKNYDYYHIMGHEEPHLVRRREILEKHPEIKNLFGYDQAAVWVAISCFLFQFVCVYFFKDCSWIPFLVTAYVLGGTCTHTVQILIHDVTHFTAFETVNYNRYLAILVNCVTGLPSAITFGKYHSDHHRFMNIREIDPDLPSLLEIKFLTSPAHKLFFLFFQPLFYGLRPLIMFPKTVTFYEVLNFAVVLTSDILVYYYLGFNAILWMMCSTFMGMGIHPCAGHVIAEHYEFLNKLETYDYIGIVNFFNLNVGYHTEHHDFPMIPWTRLPIVRKMAPEYYENLPYHTSYIKINAKFYRYVFDGYMGPWSRIIRKVTEDKKGQ